LAQNENSLYRSLAREPHLNIGQTFDFDGKVIQSVQSGRDYVLRIDVTRGDYDIWRDTAYVEYTAGSETERRIVERDVVTFRGIFKGIKSYQAVFGQTIQIPHFVACFIRPMIGIVVRLAPGIGCEPLKGGRTEAAPTAIALGGSAPGEASQQPFPSDKSVEMTVMFGAGSAADFTARYLASGMAQLLNVPVPVVNRTGGGGAIGYSHVAKQMPDGHSIIWNSNSISTTYHAGVLPFDYRTFDAVARVSIETPAIAVRADAPWKTLQALIDYAKANPGKVRIGNSGIGSHTHLSASALFAAVGAKVVDVPFGDGQPVINLLGGRIEGVVQLPAALMSHVKSGNLRVLAVLGSKPDLVFPKNVQTASELGYPVTLDMWRGIAVPKGTPKAIIAKLQEVIRRTVDSQPFKDAGKTIGFTPAYLAADDFGGLIASDDAKLAQLMTHLGLKKN
jgi:tripartite-type tricarboxylate transporter receptor subunit TctC